ncbi:hypothetical protein [Actinomadura sp. CNU-125]|uniref:hypothetical protein n=1 Tax=Actinomadura sp. CNU-125 TaxID=1904961 RepID=UPI00291653E1|nr:hypothetical protein [Actinomadura sp. CNU-125]
MRGDLGPQRPHLRLHELRAGAVQLGELQLGADPLRDLLGRPDEPRRDVLPVRGERADHPVVGGQRHDDDTADQAVEPLALDVVHLRAPVPERRLGVPGHLAAVVLAVAVPRERPLPVGDREPGAAEQRPQVPRGLLRALLGEPPAERRRGPRRGVQRLERRAPRGPAEVAARPAPAAAAAARAPTSAAASRPPR